MLLVFREGIRVDKHVVKVDNEELVKEVMEGVVHIMLEGTQRIAQAKGHDRIFEEAISAAEGCLPFLPWGYMESVVTITYIELGEELGTADSIQELADEG